MSETRPQEAPPPPTEGGLPVLKSLRARGMLATLALLIYLLGSVAYIALERAQVDQSIGALDLLARHEKALALTDSAVAAALIDVSEAGNAAQLEPTSPSELRLYMESCERLFAALDEFDPRYALLQQGIVRAYGALVEAPVRSNWIELREALRRASEEFDLRHHQLADERNELNARYRHQFDSVTVKSILLAVIGMTAFGSIAALFFARLARDLGRLERHARQIVHGSRGVALDVRREDEVGRLMQAVNRMSADLEEREKQIEFSSHRQSHQDKMLAVGALAAGIAHEVNNPLMVISSAAQDLQTSAQPSEEQVASGAQLILSQVQRASQAARQLADVAEPQPAELSWLDLNDLLRRVVRLMGYDRRYRQFPFEVQADAALPAVHTSGEAIQQLLMQLLSMGCDACVARGQAGATVQLCTRLEDADVVVAIGLPPVLDFNQRDVQRSLLLCRALIEPLHGRLAFSQDKGEGLRIKLSLPADGGGQD